MELIYIQISFLDRIIRPATANNFHECRSKRSDLWTCLVMRIARYVHEAISPFPSCQQEPKRIWIWNIQNDSMNCAETVAEIFRAEHFVEQWVTTCSITSRHISSSYSRSFLFSAFNFNKLEIDKCFRKSSDSKSAAKLNQFMILIMLCGAATNRILARHRQYLESIWGMGDKCSIQWLFWCYWHPQFHIKQFHWILRYWSWFKCLMCNRFAD